jgi:TM2 domain-containing membrane protein YozV
MTDNNSLPGAGSAKSIGLTYVLWAFLGGFGAHRMYVGRVGSGFGQLALLIGSIVTLKIIVGLIGLIALSIWWIADAFLIPGMIRAYDEALAKRDGGR